MPLDEVLRLCVTSPLPGLRSASAMRLREHDWDAEPDPLQARRAAGKALLKQGQVDLGPLDQAVDRLATGLLQTFPNCLMKTIESLRKHKLQHWDRNKETNRQWLGLNMLTEARAGFRAFPQAVASSSRAATSGWPLTGIARPRSRARTRPSRSPAAAHSSLASSNPSTVSFIATD